MDFSFSDKGDKGKQDGQVAPPDIGPAAHPHTYHSSGDAKEFKRRWVDQKSQSRSDPTFQGCIPGI